MSGRERWEAVAHNWAAWVRTPRHDWYWAYREPFFHAIVPPPGRATLDLGCGEGRVARDLRDAGHTVTGVDGSPTLIRLAREADDASTYVEADAASLPFDDGAFDLVVAYNSLMDFDDLDGAMRETSRVLAPGGRLAACIVHPLRNVMQMESYFARATYELRVERAGLTMAFRSWVRPLEDYATAMTRAGLLIERVREIADVEPRRFPEFMHLRAVKRAP